MLKPLAVIVLAAILIAPSLPVSAQMFEPSDEYKRSCANVLDGLPRIVRKSEVAAIPSNARISFHYLCRGVGMTTFGNAAGLRVAIEANHALSRALAASGYVADDVIALQIYGANVQVYVHREGDF